MFVESNPKILDERNEPWPGGTLHQLSTVGIEIMKVVDEVTARMPSNAETEAWDLPPGIPLLFCRRLSYDRYDTLIEISNAWYPADRAELRFVTPLQPWPESPQRKPARLCKGSRQLTSITSGWLLISLVTRWRIGERRRLAQSSSLTVR
jgi:hypothetical protein